PSASPPARHCRRAARWGRNARPSACAGDGERLKTFEVCADQHEVSHGPGTTEAASPAPARLSGRRRVTIPAAMSPILRDFPELDRRIWILAAARVIVTAGFAAVMPFLAM